MQRILILLGAAFYCVLFPLVDSQSLHAEGNDGRGGGKKKDQRLRHKKRNKQGGGKKLKLSQTVDASSNSYGASLPAFAFDYSEYLASAVIERSSLSDNLYLTMFFVGHRSIAHDWPFDMISTGTILPVDYH